MPRNYIFNYVTNGRKIFIHNGFLPCKFEQYEFRASKMCWNLNRCANIWFASTAKSLEFQRIRSIEIESNVSNSICKPIECFSNVPFSNNASKLCGGGGGFEWCFWMTNSNDVHDLSMQCIAMRCFCIDSRFDSTHFVCPRTTFFIAWHNVVSTHPMTAFRFESFKKL